MKFEGRRNETQHKKYNKTCWQDKIWFRNNIFIITNLTITTI